MDQIIQVTEISIVAVGSNSHKKNRSMQEEELFICSVDFH